MTNKVKVKSIKTDFRGTVLPKEHDLRGRAFEQILKNLGNPVAVGAGADYPKHGLEVKTKDTESTSANSVGSILYEDIKTTPYSKSSIAEKLQQQYRVKVKDGIVVSNKIYDFSKPHIQAVLENAYETARAKIIAGDNSNYITGGEFGHFERKKLKGGKLTNSWVFRIPVKSMDKLEGMAQSMFNELFD
jgi:hypothetical protein